MKATGQNFVAIGGSHGPGKVPMGRTCKAKDQEPDQGTNDYHKSLEMMQHHPS
jgi:hypothetical protein